MLELGPLIERAEYKALKELKPKFNLFSLLHSAIHETAWSQIFASLLDSTQIHGLGERFFLTWLCRALDLKVNDAEILHQTQLITRVSTECMTHNGRRIDILVRVLSNDGTVIKIIAIENKLFSPESHSQISDYQYYLCDEYRDIDTLLVFLTPRGRTSVTADKNSRCPCIEVSYQTIIDACKAVSYDADAEVQVLLNSISREIESSVLGVNAMSHEAQVLVRRLWSNPEHRSAMRMIRDYIPTLKNLCDSGLLDSLISSVSSFGMVLDDKSIYYYPKRWDNPQEIKIWPADEFRAITDMHVGIIYMLHCSDSNPDIGSTYTLRLMAWYESDEERDIIYKMSIKEKLPLGNACKNWGSWDNLWTGGSYTLHDLAEADLTGLAKLIIEGARSTFPALIAALRELKKV